MVQINPNFGPRGLGHTGKTETTNEPPVKPETVVQPLVIQIDGKTVYDDGKQDVLIDINSKTGEKWIGIWNNDPDSYGGGYYDHISHH